MNKLLSKTYFFIYTCLLLTGCVKDTDFNQTQDVLLTPVVELDLIYFNLKAESFFDTINSNPILTVSDTTEIKFLDDSTLQESLKRSEFYFRFTNSIPRNFEIDFQFLTESNDITYTTSTMVAEGTVSAPVVTEFIEVVNGDNILNLTKANKVVVLVTIPSSNENLEGILSLKSKTTYFLEY